MVDNFSIPSRIWNGSSVVFSYTASGSNDHFQLRAYVSGVLKASIDFPTLSGSYAGNGTFAYSSSTSSVIVDFILWRIPNSGGDQLILQQSYNIPKTLPSNPNAVTLSFSNLSYNQNTISERKISGTVNYVINDTNAAPISSDVTIYLQFKSQSGVNTGIEDLIRTLSSTSGNFPFSFFDQSPYPLFPYDSIIVEAYMWRNSDGIPVSQSISNVVNLINNTAPPAPVLSATSNNRTINLSWTGSDSVDIERADTLGNNVYSVLIGSLSTNSITYDLPDITNTYYYRVRAKNSVGYSSYSNVIVFPVTASTAPPPVVGIPAAPIISSRAKQGGDPNNDIEVFCTPVNDGYQYRLEVINPNTDFWVILIPASVIPPINNEIIFPISLGSVFGTYQFRVKAKNTDGVYGNYSNIISVVKINNTPTGEQTQQIFQISTPNNANTIRGTFNSISAAKWIYDNSNSLLCNYPQFAGLNVPCSLSYYIIPDILVSEPDNFYSVIEQIRVRYSGSNTPPTTGAEKNLIKLLTGVLSMGLGLTLLGNKK